MPFNEQDKKDKQYFLDFIDKFEDVLTIKNKYCIIDECFEPNFSVESKCYQYVKGMKL